MVRRRPWERPALGPWSRPLRWALVAQGLLEAPLRAEGYTSYRTAKDVETSQLAERRAQEDCSKVDLSGVDRGSGLDALTASVGGRNIVREALVESSSNSELWAKFREKIDAGWAIMVFGPLAFSFLLAFVWLFCCWTACPFCRCCRRCAQQRKTSIVLRAVVLALLAIILLAMLVCAFVAYEGKGDIEDGRNTVMCSAARVLNSTLNGNVQHSFLGMLPMLDEMARLRSILDDNSAFVSSVFNIVDGTAEIQRATHLAEQTTALFAAMLSEPANLNPPPSQASRRSLHRCELCARLAAPAAELSEQLAGGAASGLAAARREVERQLGPESRRSLRRTFDSSVRPLRDASDTVRDIANLFLKEDIKSQLDAGVTATSAIIITISVVVFLLGACSASVGAVLATRELDEVKEMEDRENPWHPAIAPCACCAWCWGWLYAFSVFLLGGLLTLLAAPLGGTCLLMRDVDSQLVRDVLPATGLSLDTTGSTFLMLSEVIDSCFSLKAEATNRSLMDIVYVEEAGNRTTLRQKLQSQTSSLMDGQFAIASAQIASANVSLMGSRSMASLLALLRDTPVDEAIVAQPEVRRHAVYSGLFLDPRGESTGVQGAVGSSLACTDSGTSLGLTNLTVRVQGFTSSPLVAASPAISCPGAGTVVCNRDPGSGAPIACPMIGSDACGACQAANSFMELKAELFNLNSYRCDVFQTPAGGDCDPKDMVKVAGVWQNDCLQTDQNGEVVVQVKRKTCTLGQFKTYMAEWQARLTQVLTRLDEAVPAVQSEIATSLQDLIKRDISQPVDMMAASAQCGFLRAEYSEFLDGLCFQGIVGFGKVGQAYVWNGSFAVLFVLVSYSIWRRAVDNRTEWARAHSTSEQTEVTIIPMDGKVLPILPTVPAAPWAEPVHKKFVEPPEVTLDPLMPVTPKSPALQPLHTFAISEDNVGVDSLCSADLQPEPESPPRLPGRPMELG